MKTKKQKEVLNWLEANPEKTERDWLIEERCSTDEQRDSLNEILDLCDEYTIPYEIGLEICVPNEYAEYLSVNKDEVYGFYQRYKYDLDRVPIDFESLNSQRLKDGDEKQFVESKAIDVYFPSLGWLINIGEEIDEAVAECHRKTWSDGKGSDIVSSVPIRHLVNGFLAYLENKYKQPLEEQRNRYDKQLLLPWNNSIAKSESINKYQSLPFDIGETYQFIRGIFKEKFEEVKAKIVSKRREKFLSLNPEIKNKREEMLHTLVIAMQKEKGLGESLHSYDINRLLEIVDNELTSLYPEYRKLSVI